MESFNLLVLVHVIPKFILSWYACWADFLFSWIIFILYCWMGSTPTSLAFLMRSDDGTVLFMFSYVSLSSLVTVVGERNLCVFDDLWRAVDDWGLLIVVVDLRSVFEWFLYYLAIDFLTSCQSESTVSFWLGCGWLLPLSSSWSLKVVLLVSLFEFCLLLISLLLSWFALWLQFISLNDLEWNLLKL